MKTLTGQSASIAQRSPKEKESVPGAPAPVKVEQTLVSLFPPSSKGNRYNKKNLSGLQSIYKPVFNHLSLYDVLKVLHSPQDAQKTKRIRELKQNELFLKSLDQDAGTVATANGLKEKRRELKESLPSVIFSGHIPIGETKSYANVEYHTGYFVLDFDHVGDFEKAYSIIRECPFSCLVFRSPSGDGIKAVVFAPGATKENHKGYLEQITSHYSGILSDVGIKADPTGINVNRHCFLPYEPTAELKENTAPFIVDPEALQAWQNKQNAHREANTTGTPYEALEALKKAHTKADKKYEEDGIRFEDAKHVWIANFSIYAKRFGANESHAREYVYENILPESEITTDPFSPFRSDEYPAGDWTKPEPFKLDVKATTRTISGQIGKSKPTCQALENFIAERDRVQLQAPTGSGKTYWAFNMLLSWLQAKGKKLVFVAPTQNLAEQIAKDPALTRNGHPWPLIMQGSDKYDFAAAQESPVIIATYHSLHKIATLINDDVCLVVDESHHLLADASTSFCFQACNDVLELAAKAWKTVCISGTPHEFMSLLGFEFFKICQSDTPNIHINPINYEPGKVYESVFAFLKGLKYTKRAGIHAVLWDNKDSLAKLADALAKSGIVRREHIAILDSDRKKDEPYQAILNDQELTTNTRLILSTRLISDGVNIKNKPGKIAMVDVENQELFAQFPARFRNAKSLNVYSFRTPRETRPMGDIYQAIEKAKETASSLLVDIERYTPTSAQKSQINGIGKLKQDDFTPIYPSRFGGKYVVSNALIFYREIARRDRLTGTDDFYQIICEKYPHFQLAETETIEAKEDAVLKAICKDQARRKRKAEKAVCDYLKKDPNTVLLAIAEKDQAFKRSLDGIPLAAEPKKVERFKKLHPDVFELKAYTKAKRFVKLRKAGIDDQAAANIAIGTKEDFTTFQDRLHYHTILFLSQNAPHLLTATEKAQAAHYQKIGERLKPTNQAMTNKELAFVLQTTTTNKAVTLAKRFYEVKHESGKENGKTVRYYLLQNRLTLESVLSPLGMRVDTFLLENRLNLCRGEKANTLKTSVSTELHTLKKNSVYSDTWNWWDNPHAVWNATA